MSTIVVSYARPSSSLTTAACTQGIYSSSVRMAVRQAHGVGRGAAFDCPDVAAIGAVTVAILRANDAALVFGRAGCGAAAGLIWTARIDRRTTAKQGMGECWSSILLEWTEVGRNIQHIAGTVAGDVASSGVADQVVALRRDWSATICVGLAPS